MHKIGFVDKANLSACQKDYPIFMSLATRAHGVTVSFGLTTVANFVSHDVSDPHLGLEY